jgi:hypothetical protein
VELDALKAELKRLRREVGRVVARARIEADPGPTDGEPLFNLPGDNVTIWYTVTGHEGQEVISVQHVSLDT